jgi:hypothetical protein
MRSLQFLYKASSSGGYIGLLNNDGPLCFPSYVPTFLFFKSLALNLCSFQALLAIGGFAVASLYTRDAFRLTSFADLPSIEVESILINAFGAASDLSIAGTMVYLLSRSRTGLSRTDSLINRLVRSFFFSPPLRLGLIESPTDTVRCEHGSAH